jgi:glucose/arabinose dehydrogenase
MAARRYQGSMQAGFGALLLAVAASCAPGDTTPAVSLGECDPDNGGITLPEGFCAVVFAELDGYPRHIVVRPDGDVFVAATRRRDSGVGGVYALRDTTADGRADVVVRFGPDEAGGTGIDLSGDDLWFAPDDAVLRYTVPAGSLEPAAGPDTIVSGLPADRSHRAKSLALAGGSLFVNIGSRSNSCQDPDRQAQVPGVDPCPELETRAGIWRFDAGRTGQTQADGERYATGIRNAVAMAIDAADGQLYAVQHGRDQLAANWGFTEAASAEKPAEELFRVMQGDDFGWPYCYFDPEPGRKVLAPEYGGDGQTEGRCAEAEGPLFAFPAHWAPNDLLFYSGDNFPARYRQGVFVVFHGSWNRAPLPQGGYNVVFLPFNAGAPLASFEIFADGFAGASMQPGEAAHRPTGIAQGPDGAVYITDDQARRIWRVTYRGT